MKRPPTQVLILQEPIAQAAAEVEAVQPPRVAGQLHEVQLRGSGIAGASWVGGAAWAVAQGGGGGSPYVRPSDQHTPSVCPQHRSVGYCTKTNERLA